jgi:H+/Cl- antiporter ClcA
MGELIVYVLKKKRALRKNYQQLIYVALCGLIIAALAYFVDSKTFGSGKEIMVTTLFTNHKHLEWYVPFLRIIGPIVSFSTGVSGGIFAPSLSAGASIGAVLAGWAHLSNPATNLLILCGMTGFLTSVTRSPFTASILVLEMTNSHNVIFFIMLTALLSNLTANFVSRNSFYDYLKEQYIDEVFKNQPKKKPD